MKGVAVRVRYSAGVIHTENYISILPRIQNRYIEDHIRYHMQIWKFSKTNLNIFVNLALYNAAVPLNGALQLSLYPRKMEGFVGFPISVNSTS